MEKYFSKFRRFINYFMNIYIKSDGGKLERNLINDIDIIQLTSPKFLNSNYRYLTADEIRRGRAKKYKKKDKTPALWITFAEMLPTNIFDDIIRTGKLIISRTVPLDFNGDVSLFFLWKNTFYFNRETMSFYNLSRIKSYSIRETNGYTELLLSNEENLEENIKDDRYMAFISIKNKKNILDFCKYLASINHPLSDEIRCLIECSDIVDEFDIFDSFRYQYGKTIVTTTIDESGV